MQGEKAVNVLKRDKQVLVTSMLADGCSVRSIERVTGVHRDTVLRLLGRVGKHCQRILDERMQNLRFDALELDELWGFVWKKERSRKPNDPVSWGDQYVFIAQDPVSKLVPQFTLGKRTVETTECFINELSSRVLGGVQLSTDGFSAYRAAIRRAFGSQADYMMVVKTYAADQDELRRYSPPRIAGVDRVWIQGFPRAEWVCTSHVEAQNAGLRTALKRFARLTLCFSKKWENLLAAVRLHFAEFNFVRRHNTLRMTPAMAAGLTDRFWKITDLVPPN